MDGFRRALPFVLSNIKGPVASSVADALVDVAFRSNQHASVRRPGFFAEHRAAAWASKANSREIGGHLIDAACCTWWHLRRCGHVYPLSRGPCVCSSTANCILRALLGSRLHAPAIGNMSSLLTFSPSDWDDRPRSPADGILDRG